MVHSNAMPQIMPIRTDDSYQVLSVASQPSTSVYVVSCDDKCVRIINAATGQTLKKVGGFSQNIREVAFSKNGKLFAAGDNIGNIFIYSAESGKLVKQVNRGPGHRELIVSLSFHPDNNTLASCAIDGLIKVWDIDANKLISQFVPSSSQYIGAYFANDKLFTLHKEIGVCIYSTEKISGSAKPICTINPIEGSTYAGLGINPSGGLVCVSSLDGKISVCKTSDGRVAKNLKGEFHLPVLSSFHSKKNFLAACCTDGSVSFYSVKSGEVVLNVDGMSLDKSVATFTGDGRYFLSVNNAGHLSVYKFVF